MRAAARVAAGVRTGDRRALARVLTWIEAGDPRAGEAISAAGCLPCGAPVVGITGAPGAGKSTLTSRLVALLRACGYTVGVLAVDPSSPLTGGALLGDRIRMSEHLADPGVYIRSMATRGQLGGLAVAVPTALRALDCYGFDWLIVETVGVGQIEVDVAEQADTVVVVTNPGWGDDVQAGKAGLMEVADVFVVNKADRPGADDTVRELTAALDLVTARAWRPPVVPCTAQSGDGVDQVWGAVCAHAEHARAGGEWDARRRGRRVREFRAVVRDIALRAAEEELAGIEGATLCADVAAGRTDPLVAARRLLRAAR